MDTLQDLARFSGTLLEYFGVFVIVVGGLGATLWFFVDAKRVGLSHAYHECRRIFGRTVILGLDFLIAGDIIRTVTVSHTITNVVVLAMIVVVRYFLSVTTELSIEGRLPFPWKERKE